MSACIQGIRRPCRALPRRVCFLPETAQNPPSFNVQSVKSRINDTFNNLLQGVLATMRSNLPLGEV